jgi:hypothetical protein
MARRQGFLSSMGNAGRSTVVLDENPISLLRQAMRIGRMELAA